MNNHYTLPGLLAALWGAAGVALLLSSAIYRLGQRALEIQDYSLGFLEWGVLVVWSVFMMVSEGYRGFQKGFSPRVAARARWLARNPAPVRGLLAPAFCMGFFTATRRRMIASWAVTCGIVLLIVAVSFLEQPWRGIVDTGVVLGLLWGLVAMLIYLVKAFAQPAAFDHDPETGQ